MKGNIKQITDNRNLIDIKNKMEQHSSDEISLKELIEKGKEKMGIAIYPQPSNHCIG
jgi:hypothetical protein